MMQGKFLMLAEKLWVEPEVMEKINEGFKKTNEEYEKKVEKVEDKIEEKMEEKGREVKVDITKPHEAPMPSEEDIDKMEKDELIVFAKWIIKKPAQEDMGRANGQENSPYMVMMKKQGY